MRAETMPTRSPAARAATRSSKKHKEIDVVAQGRVRPGTELDGTPPLYPTGAHSTEAPTPART
jgi:hypothetical protein